MPTVDGRKKERVILARVSIVLRGVGVKVEVEVEVEVEDARDMARVGG